VFFCTVRNIAGWFSKSRIDGVNLESVGVVPDIEVLFDVRYCSGNDLQLNQAVEYLGDKL